MSWSPSMSSQDRLRSPNAASRAVRLPAPVPVTAPMRSRSLRGHDLQVDRGEDQVDEEGQQERDHYGLVDRVADALRARLGIQAAVRGDHARDEPEDQRLDLADEQVRGLRKRGEAGQEGARGAVLQVHEEEVAA